MSATSSEIRVRAFPRVTKAQIGVLAGLLVVALAAGLILGRVTSPRTEAKAAGSESVVSTTWLDDTPEFRQQIMAKMNSLPVEAPNLVGTAGVTLNVIEHELAASQLGTSQPFRFHRSPIGVRVMRHMNELQAGS